MTQDLQVLQDRVTEISEKDVLSITICHPTIKIKFITFILANMEFENKDWLVLEILLKISFKIDCLDNSFDFDMIVICLESSVDL